MQWKKSSSGLVWLPPRNVITLEVSGQSLATPSFWWGLSFYLVTWPLSFCPHLDFPVFAQWGRRALITSLKTLFWGYLLICCRGRTGMSISQSPCWGQRIICRSWFFVSIMWVPGVKLRSSGLTAKAFACWAISLALVSLFIGIQISAVPGPHSQDPMWPYFPAFSISTCSHFGVVVSAWWIWERGKQFIIEPSAQAVGLVW